MDFSIRHFIPGRIRLHVPTLCRKRSLAEAALAWLSTQKGIRHARMNYDCASLIIAYDVAYEAPLRAIIGRLSVMSLDDLKAMVGSGPPDKQRPAALTKVAPPSAWRRMPLTLPPSAWEAWLDPEQKEGAAALAQAQAATLSHLEPQRVSTWVNSSKNEGPRCIEPMKPG